MPCVTTNTTQLPAIGDLWVDLFVTAALVLRGNVGPEGGDRAAWTQHTQAGTPRGWRATVSDAFWDTWDTWDLRRQSTVDLEVRRQVD